MNQINSYPSIYAIGHKAIADIFSGPVLVEEKIDGSQFSMARIDGELACRSKGAIIVPDAPEKMFVKAIETAKSLDLHPNWVYRCEYLQKPKHNTLVYDRVPAQHLIVFDICVGVEEYLSPEDKIVEAQRLGLECVSQLFNGVVDNFEKFTSFFDTVSVLGGSKIEGVVVKNYSLFTIEKKIALGKYVSEVFKEVHGSDWKERNPTNKDITQALIEKYRSVARWNKAVQHIRDKSGLDNSPRDIGPLMREVPDDILKEEEDAIRDTLFNHFWPQIKRGITAGLPEWYKEELAKSVFENNNE